MRPITAVRAASRSPLLQVVKTSLASVIAWVAAWFLLDQPLPIFATIAALLVVQPSLNQSLAKGIERSLGVLLGVLLAYGASHLFGDSSWGVLGIIVVALFLAWALRLTPGSTNQIPISAMLVLAIGAGNTADYALERVIETVIGVIVALIVNFAIVPPVLREPSRRAVRELANRIADTLDELSQVLTRGTDRAELQDILTRARRLRALQRDAAEQVTRAEESLLLNPRRGIHREEIAWDAELLRRLNVLVTRVLGMTRAVHDHYDETLRAEPMVRAIGSELDRAAHDLRLLAAPRREPDAEPLTSDLPALTAPLAIAVPHPEHWILIGALMEDLRRVREEIMGGREDA
ncbi:FUSC family protein [Salinibacterium sp. dk2585]|uniref:FUSC family protein n=1 Tax=unclassified Salinibacterium TaxID=2632331 RepID=UPI0011C24929|nr:MULTISPECIES: FUSC family protein [unclassified Salinibacterium]QEE61418.1 FUSC family protein [Salinibacterium sp. dk2585]TXK54095.1 FUSC family protein [Salinibacterium sp. dk5596]